MLLTEFFNTPEGDSYADNQATSKATQAKRPQVSTTNEHIEKVSGGYRLVSKKSHKNLGTYPTKAGAKKRERQVQYFKHANEDLNDDNSMSDIINARQLAKKAMRNVTGTERDDYFKYLKHLRTKHGAEYSTRIHQEASRLDAIKEEFNPEDTITVDIPLFIRLMEYAREDAKTDMDLHNVAERITALSAEGRTLTMDDYNEICNTKEQE